MKLFPENVVKELGLKLSNLSIGNSILMGLVFYETHLPDCYLTNFNVNAGEGVDPDLTKKDMVLLFGTKRIEGKKAFNSVLISNEALADSGFMRFAFQYFEASFERIIV